MSSSARVQFAEKFEKACEEGDVATVETMMEETGNIEWRFGMYTACVHGHVNIAHIFIRHAVCSNSMGLHGSCEGGHRHLVEFFLSRTTAVSAEPLYISCKHGHTALAEFFIATLTPEHISVWQEQIFEEACRYNMTNVIQTMLSHFPEDPLEGAVQGAVHGGHLELLKMLMARGGQITHRAVSPALESDNEEVMRLVLDHTSDYEIYLLGEACSCGNLWVVKYLIERLGGVIGPSVTRWALEGVASGTGSVEIARLLLCHGTTHHETILTAWDHGHADLVQLLFDHGGRLSDIDDDRISACTNRKLYLLAILENRHNINYSDAYRLSNFDLAWLHQQGHTEFGEDTKRMERYVRWRTSAKEYVTSVACADVASVVLTYI
jgi:hypothetical protein